LPFQSIENLIHDSPALKNGRRRGNKAGNPGTFTARWASGDGGQERANYALFLSEDGDSFLFVQNSRTPMR